RPSGEAARPVAGCPRADRSGGRRQGPRSGRGDRASPPGRQDRAGVADEPKVAEAGPAETEGTGQLHRSRSRIMKNSTGAYAQAYTTQAVVEQWNSANVAIRYGRDAELPGPDREHQEISMLAPHLLQSALVLVNTRMVDRVLAAPEWAERLTDLRGLTPLFWSNVALHGTFELDLDKR